MILRRRPLLLRIALLVVVQLLLLIGLCGYTAATSVGSALTLIRSKTTMDDLARPVFGLQQALTRERAQVMAYGARPNPAALAALRGQEQATDRAVASFMTTADSRSVQQSASAGARKAIGALRAGLAGLPGLRAGIASDPARGQQAFNAYSNLIAAGYRVMEQAIIQEGSSAQVLAGIAVVELAISNEYLEQESALLNGYAAARTFTVSDRLALARLVGAHRLLYVQIYPYLDPADQAALNHDVNPATARTLAALENRLMASSARARTPPVSLAAWNGAVTAVSAQTQRAVEQAEARLAAGAHAQADSKLRGLFLVGGLGLAAVISSLLLTVWTAANLARQVRRLRDSALEMANVRLPDIVRRLRGGEDVDVAGLVPMLEPGPDEIGQVRAAFNTAQRTALEAAADEARVRRGINDVFRNLARRNQALLERQLALIDTLEWQADEPEHLASLFRIDHLTTRMRRHAESLIVLAGDSSRRSFPASVAFVDVLRAAAAEVEEYPRVMVICKVPAALVGHAVADVVHMLAEFVENATIFSPPSTEVQVTGDLVGSGFVVEIEDHGLGMSGDDLAAANASLNSPPLFDLSGSDRFGLFVAAQLARRHGIQVTLCHSTSGGTTAIVLIPSDLVVPADGLARGAVGPDRASNGHWAAALGPALAAEPLAARPGPAGNSLPQRVHQPSLAAQPRDRAAPAPVGATAGGHRSPEKARSVITAYRRGWQQGADDAARERDDGRCLSPPQGGSR
jgi:signal transduction histidine kinase